MTPEQWANLRRGDLIRKSGETGLYQIIAVRPPVILLADHRIAEYSSDLILVNEQGQPIGNDGEPLPEMLEVCLMCEGTGRIPEKDICPRCNGKRSEPTNINEVIVTLRLFYPEAPGEFPQVIVQAQTEFSHAQTIELLEKTLKTFRGMATMQESTTSKLVN